MIIHFLRRQVPGLPLTRASRTVADGACRFHRAALRRVNDNCIFSSSSASSKRLVRNDAIIHFGVRRFQETEIIYGAKLRKIVDKTDVRTFRRLNRTDAAVMGAVHVAHFERCAFAGKTAGTERRERRLCSNSAKGFTWSMNCESWEEAKNSLMTAVIGRKLMSWAGTSVSRLRVDMRSWTMRRKRARPMRKTALQQFAHRFHAAVAQVVDVVRLSGRIVIQPDDFGRCR
jgi:hypothetical protein